MQSQNTTKSDHAAMKMKLYKELKSLYGRGLNTHIANTLNLSSETVRQYFQYPSRKNAEIENTAFSLLEKLRTELAEKNSRI